MKPAGKNPEDNIAEFWQTHFKESQNVTIKISTYNFFTETKHYMGEDYQSFTARSGRMIRSTKNKNTKNKLYNIEPRIQEAIMFFQQSSINTPGRSIGETDKTEEGTIIDWDQTVQRSTEEACTRNNISAYRIRADIDEFWLHHYALGSPHPGILATDVFNYYNVTHPPHAISYRDFVAFSNHTTDLQSI